MGERNVTWVITEMEDSMKDEVEKEVNKAIDTMETEKDISMSIKNYFDKTYQPNWHCVVGKHFASYATF